MSYCVDDILFDLRLEIEDGNADQAEYLALKLAVRSELDRLRLLEKWWQEAERDKRILLGTIDKIVERTK
jgi:hypothetical protein